MRIHFISIGGAVMHNLALELKANGHQVTGSDDEIYEPSRSRLDSEGLLPDKMGWDANRITSEINLIILGMHARPNNPELLRAQELNLPIQSFPEYIGEHAQDKIQIVVAGSHGKTTTTSMIMHVLREAGKDFDYLVGAQLEGFDRMVRLSDAPIIVIEGDEYLSSPIDRRPKFVHYNPSHLIITGIEWDHMNVFPTFEDYVNVFGSLLCKLDNRARVFYDLEDEKLVELVTSEIRAFDIEAYEPIAYQVKDGKFYLKETEKALGVVGGHNMKNLSAARKVLRSLDISDEIILSAFATFSGASKRQDLLLDTEDLVIYRDFAHAPSKVRATLKGIRELYPKRYLIAVCELHTFSSLNKAFLPQYADAMQPAEVAAVFYSPHTLEIKKMPPLDEDDIRQAFNQETLSVFTNKDDLAKFLEAEKLKSPAVMLLMSSGTFGGLEIG